MKTQKYSLWLMPDGIVGETLEKTVKELAKTHGGPIFRPHVTLLGSIETTEEEILEKSAALAGDLSPYDIKLTRAEYLEKYFQCVFVHIEETEQVMRANKRAREIFGRVAGPEYMPHLSLLYGEYDEEVKKAIIQETGVLYNLMFNVSHVFVYSTEGPVENWGQVGKFDMGGKE